MGPTLLGKRVCSTCPRAVAGHTVQLLHERLLKAGGKTGGRGGAAAARGGGATGRGGRSGGRAGSRTGGRELVPQDDRVETYD